MRKGTWRTGAAIVVLLSGVGVVLGGPRVLADSRVVIGGDTESDINKWGYQPADVTVSVGSAVVWHNGGTQTHTVTADDGKSFDSGDVKPGADWQWKPTAAGDFSYHCTPHPWMKAVIHVTGASSPTPAATTQTTAPSASQAGAPSASTTATTAKPGTASTTTSTTAAPGAAATTTTTAAAAVTTTTAAGAATSSAAPAAEASTTTTTGAGAKESAAGGGHGSRGGKTNVPLVTLAGLATLMLAGLSLKLIATKS